MMNIHNTEALKCDWAAPMLPSICAPLCPGSCVKWTRSHENMENPLLKTPTTLKSLNPKSPKNSTFPPLHQNRGLLDPQQGLSNVNPKSQTLNPTSYTLNPMHPILLLHGITALKLKLDRSQVLEHLGSLIICAADWKNACQHCMLPGHKLTKYP